jgi:protein-S-isoprenylcysteine O-methyltransferase Ste14
MKYMRAVLFMISTIAIYLGFTLLGWGFGDLKGYFSLPPRTGYAGVVVLFGLCIGWQAIESPEGIEGGKGEKSKLVQRETIVGGVITLIAFASLVGLPFLDRHKIASFADNQTVRWLGLAMTALGYALIFLSGFALGKQYSAEVTIQKDHQLITSGIYRYIRHPRYAGLLFAAIGLSLLFRTWVGLIITGLLLAGLLLRIRDEEAMLRKEFGQKWEQYCKVSWRLLPPIY